MERRKEVRRLTLKGLTPIEIARSFGNKWDEKTIDRDLAYLRVNNRNWFKQHATLDKRLPKLLLDRIETLQLVEREAWVAKAKFENAPRTVIESLRIIIEAEKQIADLCRFTGMSIGDLEASASLQELKVELKEVKNTLHIAEQNSIRN